jgi:hypothetical protein
MGTKTRPDDFGASQNEGRGESRAAGQEGLLDEAKEAVTHVAARAREQASSQLATQKGRVAGQIDGVARALRDTSAHLRGDEQGEGVSTYIEKIANQTERFARYVNSSDPRQMFAQLERFARRDPVLFLGGAFTLGLVTARFLKSSGRPATPEISDGDRRTQGRGSGARRDASDPLPGGPRRNTPAGSAGPSTPGPTRQVGDSSNMGAQLPKPAGRSASSRPGSGGT